MQTVNTMTSQYSVNLCYFYAPAALLLGKVPPEPIEYDAVWGPRMENFLGCPARVLREYELKKRGQPEQISQNNFMENYETDQKVSQL